MERKGGRECREEGQTEREEAKRRKEGMGEGRKKTKERIKGRQQQTDEKKRDGTEDKFKTKEIRKRK